MNVDQFKYEINDKPISLFHISNSHISCSITNYGARIVNLEVPCNTGERIDVVLGFSSIGEYLSANEQYFGATVGRYANRIANGEFTLDGTQYTLAQNNPPNSLHGGLSAMHNQVWSLVLQEKDKVVFEHISPHMEEGFPGELTTRLTYELRGSDLAISYESQSTEDTIINLTHHSYFNLNGESSGSVMHHKLKLHSEYYTPIDQYCIPTGRVDLVTGTPFDFTSYKSIGLDINSKDQQLTYGSGYDHNFVVQNYESGELGFIASVIGDVSGVKMDVWSTEPGVQFYTANHLDGSDVGKSSIAYGKRCAFCLETQHFPDSPNKDQFPSTILRKGMVFSSVTEYRFSV